MLPAIGRAIFLGGGLFGNAIGGALKGAGAAAGGAAQGAGSAVGGIAQGIGTAVGGALTPAPKVVVNNVGMVGQAAKKKISGGGTLPAPKKVAKPAVNVNMPTEKLLVVAVNYLSSIDKTLQDQLKFESQAFNQQAVAEREASIEGGGTSIFTKMSDKLGGLLKTDEDSTIGSRASSITKAILAASGIAALGVLAMGGMEDTELARLKTSWAAFSEKYDWLIDLGKAVTGVGGIVGYLFKGVKGAVVGIVVDYLTERFTGKSFGDMALGSLGFGGEETDAAPAGQRNTGFDVAMGGAVAGYGAYRGVKTYQAVSQGMGKMAATRAAPSLASSGGRLGFKDPVTGKVASKAASSAGGGWLSGPKGRKFVAFLSKRFGKTYIARKVMPLLARVFAGVAVSATGVGLIPGILFTLVNIGLSLFLVYDLVSAWYDFQDEEAASKDAVAANSAKPSADASRTTTNTGSGNIAGAPTASAAQMENLPSIPADIEKILATIRTRESGGNYGIPHPIGMPGQTASGAYAFIDSSWQGLTKKYGIGTEYPKAYLAPPPIQDAVAAKYVQEILQQAGGDVSKVPLAWYTGNIQGKMSASALATNNGLTPQAYQAKWMADYTGGKYSASSYDSQGAEGGSGGSGLAASAMDLGKGLIESLSGIAKAGFGSMSGRSTTASLNSGSSFQNLSAPIPGTTPGKENAAAPIVSESKKAAEISAVSGKIQTAIDMGNPKSDPAPKVPETSGQKSLRSASNDSKLESIDPNYPGTGGVDGYLQYYRLAA
jgi:hypothetical protein